MSTTAATTVKGEESVAYETKVLLIALSDAALRTNSKEMYRIIAKMANAEGLILPSYKEAKAELENDDEEN